MIDKKRCPDCQIWKERDEFHKRKSSKDGCQTYCKECLRARKPERVDATKKRPDGAGSSGRVHVRMPMDLYVQLRLQSKARSESMNSIVEKALREHMKRTVR